MKKLILFFSTVFTFLSFQEVTGQWIKTSGQTLMSSEFQQTELRETDGVKLSPIQISLLKKDTLDYEVWMDSVYNNFSDNSYYSRFFEVQSDEELRMMYDETPKGLPFSKVPSIPLLVIESSPVFYFSHDNYIKIGGDWSRHEIVQYTVTSQDASVTTKIVNGEVWHCLNPLINKRTCEFSVIGKNKDGQEINLGGRTWVVRPLPKPTLQTQVLKKSGGRLLVGLGSDYLDVMGNRYPQYNVIEWEIPKLKITGNGNIISSEDLKKAELEVNYRISLTIEDETKQIVKMDASILFQ